MPRLNPVPPGKIALAAEWFRKLVFRVEEIKPVAGDFITTEETGDGTIINASSTIELIICKNGQPATITVVGVDGIVGTI
jgi:hypothetical protein